MSIQVLYQSLSIAKEPRFRLQDGGLFIELDSPMPVATALSVHAGEHSLQGKVRRVKEGAGAGMLVVPVEATKLPRWLLGLGAEVGAGVEFEPEPAPPPPPVVEVKPEPVVEVKPVVEAKPAEAKPEPAPAAKADAADVNESLAKLADSFRALSETVKEQQQRLGRVEKQFGLPNSAASAERVSKATVEDVGWPLDLNKPKDRESVDKAISFHDL